MSDSISIVLLILLAVAALFIIKKLLTNKQANREKNNINDTQPQVLYDQKNKASDAEKNITLEEKIELSWDFLTNITEKVLNYFSPQDQQVVNKAGAVLVEHGAKYHHNIDVEAKITLEATQSKERNQKQSIER